MEPTTTQPEAELLAGVKRTAEDAFTGVDGCATDPRSSLLLARALWVPPSVSPLSHPLAASDDH